MMRAWSLLGFWIKLNWPGAYTDTQVRTIEFCVKKRLLPLKKLQSLWAITRSNLVRGLQRLLKGKQAAYIVVLSVTKSHNFMHSFVSKSPFRLLGF